jgi:hypothetical protein
MAVQNERENLQPRAKVARGGIWKIGADVQMHDMRSALLKYPG